MILALHLTVAFGSMISAAFAYFRPSRSKIYTSYVLVALTLITGFILVFTAPAHMAEVCIVGLVYLTAVSYGIIAARNKLAVVTIK